MTQSISDTESYVTSKPYVKIIWNIQIHFRILFILILCRGFLRRSSHLLKRGSEHKRTSFLQLLLPETFTDRQSLLWATKHDHFDILSCVVNLVKVSRYIILYSSFVESRSAEGERERERRAD
jgi:hypothetical protein